ncbi:MAG: hypothetical protein HGA45_32345, partial [Chloroflexales bacterium]|nr:hypothetical protein [Chloroflexales bacterium]
MLAQRIIKLIGFVIFLCLMIQVEGSAAAPAGKLSITTIDLSAYPRVTVGVAGPPSLRPEDLRVLADGGPIAVEAATTSHAGLAVVFVIDVGAEARDLGLPGSRNRLDDARRLVAATVAGLDSTTDQVGLVAFDRDIYLLRAPQPFAPVVLSTEVDGALAPERPLAFGTAPLAESPPGADPQARALGAALGLLRAPTPADDAAPTGPA